MFIKKFSEIEVTKKDVKFFFDVSFDFKIFFQNYSLSIINAYRSLAKRLQGRERGLGESSGFSHPMGRVEGWVGISGGGDSFYCTN